MAVDVKFEGISFNGQNFGKHSTAYTAFNSYYAYYVVNDGAKCSTYYHIDRGALPILKDLATKAGVEINDSWNAAKIAEVLLKEMLGENWKKPVRGQKYESYVIRNRAIIDGYLVEHSYENDGYAWTNSIKKYAHVYCTK